MSIARKRRSLQRRMTANDIRNVVAEIEAHARGERDGRLTWNCLEAFCGFSHVALWQKAEIKEAFQRAKKTLRVDATPTIVRRSTDERIADLESTIVRLREQIRAYDELWALYEFNMQRMGLNPDDLRTPLDRLSRQEVRSPRGRSRW